MRIENLMFYSKSEDGLDGVPGNDDGRWWKAGDVASVFTGCRDPGFCGDGGVY